MEIKENLSKYILDICTKELVPKHDMPNREYLESYLSFISKKIYSYRQTSESLEFSDMERAKARDLEQNFIGLVHGIKFAIAFLDSKSIDLVGVSNIEDGINLAER